MVNTISSCSSSSCSSSSIMNINNSSMINHNTGSCPDVQLALPAEAVDVPLHDGQRHLGGLRAENVLFKQS